MLPRFPASPLPRTPPRPPPASSRRRRPPAGGSSDALRLGQQVVAPVERRPQRLLARQRRPAAAGQQPEAVVQPGGDLLDRQRRHPRRRQLERQRDAVQPPADLRHRRRVRRRSARSPAAPARARSTKRRTAAMRARSLAPAAVAASGQRAATARARSSRRRCRSGSRLVARIRRPGQAAQQRLGQRGAGVDQVLAVVQHQQQAPAGQPARPASSVSGRPGCSGDAQRARPTACGHQRRVGQRRQLDQPDAVGIVAPHRPRRPRAPAGSCRRRRRRSASAAASSPSSRRDLGHLALPADEAGQRPRQDTRGHRRAGWRGLRRPRGWRDSDAGRQSPRRHLERRPLRPGQPQRRRQQRHRRPLWRVAHPTLDVAHPARAQPGLLGQRLLVRPAARRARRTTSPKAVGSAITRPLTRPAPTARAALNAGNER